MSKLFHNVMRPPSTEEVAEVAGVPVEELLAALTGHDDELPQPVTPAPRRHGKAGLQAKVLTKLRKLVDEADIAGMDLTFSLRAR